jgi:sugar/nucleoside kinase (ribokinase family)
MAVCVSIELQPLDIIVGGDLFIDLIMSGFSSWPQPGTEAFATALYREVGGGAAIAACGLARLGSRTAVIGRVGQDGGDWVAARLNHFGVITSRLCVDTVEPTALTVAVSTPGERTFLTYHGPNRRFPEMLAEAAESGGLASARHFHLNWAPDLDTAADLFRAIRRQGCTISLDVGWHEDWLTDPRSPALLPLTDIIFPNEAEARRMTGETEPAKMLERLASAGARRVALKLGADGAALLWDGDILEVKPYPVNAIDTTGAGDCFNAGFLHFWLRGASPLTCLRAGNYCGAASTEAHGGVEGFPDPERVQNELSKTYA